MKTIKTLLISAAMIFFLIISPRIVLGISPEINQDYVSIDSDAAATKKPTPKKGTPEPPTPEIVEPVVTSTVAPNGSVVHVVGPGQSLWSIAIAYGLKIADIITLNNLQPTPQVNVGQKLVIVPSNPPTATATITPSPIPATSTVTATRTLRAAILSRTPSVLPSATSIPLSERLPFLQAIDGSVIGISLIVVCGLGLVFVIIKGFILKS